MSNVETTICILALLVALVCLGVVVSRLMTARKRIAHVGGELRAARGRHDAEAKKWAEARRALEEQNRQLAQWQVVGDAHVHAASILGHLACDVKSCLQWASAS